MATRSGKRANDPRKPQISILSVQRSKGLEVRSVIFIGLGQIETSETQADQNMKLLYRMLGNSSRHSRRRRRMTRAKERLLITASGRNEFTEKLGSMTETACAVA